jgi:hypothetical protein
VIVPNRELVHQVVVCVKRLFWISWLLRILIILFFVSFILLCVISIWLVGGKIIESPCAFPRGRDYWQSKSAILLIEFFLIIRNPNVNKIWKEPLTLLLPRQRNYYITLKKVSSRYFTRPIVWSLETISLADIRYFVVDEADTMMEKDFGEMTRDLMTRLRTQTTRTIAHVFISATVPRLLQSTIDDEFGVCPNTM